MTEQEWRELDRAVNDGFMSTMEAFDLLVTKARERTDGHFSILKFTGGWRVMLGTIAITDVPDDVQPPLYGAIRAMPEGKTFQEAVLLALKPARKAMERS